MKFINFKKSLTRPTTYYLLSTVLFCGCSSPHLYKENRILLGTFVEVTSPYKEAANTAFEEISRIEKLLSKYDPESEISRLNRSGELAVSDDTLYILKKAEEFWKLTDGIFDVTVGPLMDLWGFSDKKYILPNPEDIQKTLEGVGFDKIIFNNQNNVIKYKTSGVKIDLGGIAKGFAIEMAVKRLKEKGITSCLINAGGQVYCLGDNSGRPWRVGIKNPRKPGIVDYLELKDKAVSTSGDYEQYFIVNGRRFTHIINPETGYPVDAGIISVTVIADDSTIADCLSTSIFVLGKAKGLELAKAIANVQVKVVSER
ncbi:MAG: FAD:protein FMN transferase [Candidatus Omnitrophota bacterium]